MNNPQPRWFPTKSQLSDPEALERTLRQVLTQHYALQDKYDALAKSGGSGPEKSSAPASAPESAFPPGSGPSDTKLLGLNVEPVDVQTLADGATLKFNRTRGTFSFQ